MAEIIKELKSRRDLYPWHDWTNGKVWRAEFGADFSGSVAGFCSSIYSHAKRKGFLVHVSRDSSGVKPVVEFRFERIKKRR